MVAALLDRYGRTYAHEAGIRLADRPAVTETEAIRILQSAVARGELDAAVVAALASKVRSGGER